MKIVAIILSIAMTAVIAEAINLEIIENDYMPPLSSDQTQTDSGEVVLPNFDYNNLPDVARLQALVGAQEHFKFESTGGDMPTSASLDVAMGITEAGYDEVGLKTALGVIDEALDAVGVDAYVSFDDAHLLGRTLGILSKVLTPNDEKHLNQRQLTYFLKHQTGKLATEIKKGIDNGKIAVNEGTISSADLIKAIDKAFIMPRIEDIIEEVIKELQTVEVE